jgi:hypothetical protein
MIIDANTSDRELRNIAWDIAKNLSIPIVSLPLGYTVSSSQPDTAEVNFGKLDLYGNPVIRKYKR